MIRCITICGRRCRNTLSAPSLLSLVSTDALTDAIDRSSKKLASRRSARPWKAGEGGNLPSWLHILIRKREKRDGLPPTSLQRKRSNPSSSLPSRQKLFPPAPSELTTLIMQTNTIEGLSSIIEKHSSDGNFKDLPLGPHHLTALYRKASWIARQGRDKSLSRLVDDLDVKLFEIMPRMDMRGLSSILWSKGMLGCERLDPVLLESILRHMNATVDIIPPPLSPLSTSDTTSGNLQDPWLRGAGQSSSPSPPSRRLTNPSIKKVSVPRVSSATSKEITDLCTGLSWLSVDMRKSQGEWNPLMNAIARHARTGTLEPQQLSDVLYSLRVCGMQCEPHHLEDLSARAVKSLPHLTPAALIASNQKPSDDDIDKAIHRSTNAIANICLGLFELGLKSPARRLKEASSLALLACLTPLFAIHRGVLREKVKRQMATSQSNAKEATQGHSNESFPLMQVDDPDLLPPPHDLLPTPSDPADDNDEEIRPETLPPEQEGLGAGMTLASHFRRTLRDLSWIMTSWELKDLETGSNAYTCAAKLLGGTAFR